MAQRLHQKIWDLIQQPDPHVYDLEDYIAKEEEIQNALITLHQRAAACTASSSQPAISQVQPQAQSNSSSQSMNLPKIELPKFDGDYLKWRQFHDLFSELIHNQQIPQSQKMWYLKTSLTGEAEKLIRHFTVSDANYAAAWKVINERYENTRLLVTALLNKLLSQPTLHVENTSMIKTLHDTTQECLLSLQNLKIDTTNWDPLLLHILIKRLDRNTHTLWEQSLKHPRTLPTLKEFLNFLETRFQSLEALGGKAHKFTSEEPYRKGLGTSKVLTTITTSEPACISCKGNHPLFACQKFLQMQPKGRLSLVQKFKHCVNCLKLGHRAKNCTSRSCTKCQGKHNTLLHLEASAKGINSNSSQPSKVHTAVNTSTIDDKGEPAISLTSHYQQSTKTHMVLLGTVLLEITDKWGCKVTCRAILDSGSQINIVTEKFVQKLGLNSNPYVLHIEGIGQLPQKTQQRVNLELHSKLNGFSTRIEAHILSKIISPQPSREINISTWAIPSNIVLSDPQFHQPGPVDLLIGAEIFYSILSVGQIKLSNNLPILQNTLFGWTISGKFSDVDNVPMSAACGICSEDEGLNEQIKRFWQLEEVNEPNNYTAAERHCETHFAQNTSRDSNGRFIVRLPFSSNSESLGESRDIALQRFKSIERKLAKDEDLKVQYVKFMQEYSKLGHMQEVCFNNIQRPYYFLPHHCVIKADSSTTKLRVVFDASAKTSSNLSLNDILSKGPTIQDDVFTILLRFRFPRFVFTADIEKMYRQILVHPADRRYQLIWWRDDPSQPLKCFQLSTVTYGTTSASFLAIRCLNKLAEEEADKYPLGAEILKRDFYIDDVLTGSDQLSTALEMQLQLRTILQSAGLNLRKWCANHPRLLQHIPTSDQEVQLDFDDQKEDHVKTMGLIWSPKTDSFSIKCQRVERRKITKRTALSDIARIFDPLGFLAPVVVSAKLFLQKLWALKIDWDAALPQELYTHWINFREGLETLNNIQIPRHVFAHQSPKRTQFHIFADASERAYGAAAYVRTINKDNVVVVRLLCAKSKVAPIKQTSIPRLELCAATVAAELANRIKTDLQLKNETTSLWTDSTAVLGWINSKSSKFDKFIANRVSIIQQMTISQQWRYVKTDQNPADLLSRGVAPKNLASNYLWFYGPQFLHGDENIWPKMPDTYQEYNSNETEKQRAIFIAHTTSSVLDCVEHHNSFRRLQRIVAYVCRFVNQSKRRSDTNITTCHPSVTELEQSLHYIIKIMQRQELSDDIAHLRKYGEVSKTSSISTLTPFIDDKGIIRVGGRLESSSLNYDAKHPMLLPYKHSYTKMLLIALHTENFHVGPQALLAIARQRYWPIKGKIIARSVVQHCVRCTRAKPKLFSQLMGNLPADRVQPARPFVNTGVDFCGPVWIHFKIRGKRPQKAYIAVFCCFATKAVHLELVSDLTSEAFLGALKRFMARRGSCKTIYCDNATNFVGAKNQLCEISQMTQDAKTRAKITTECSLKGTDFKFIPPRTPHFGGLWEAAVKSAKHLLQRTLASASLTYEEMETVVVQVEAIMNSRPITSLPSSPNDLSALTPAHLLIGEPLTSNVDSHARPSNSNLLTRWKLVSHLKNEFWQRWSHEYLNQLQQRYKWKQKSENIKPGTIVIIKDDNLPPLKWPLGRITKVIQGPDGLVRVAELKTVTNIVRRPIHRLAPLPTEEEQNSGQYFSDSEDLEPCSQSTHGENEESFDANTNQPPDPAASHPRKKIRLSMGSAIASLLITCLLLPITHSFQVRVLPFSTNPGLYFENLGATNIISSEWNLIAYYDMKPYWSEFEKLLNCSTILHKTCALMHDPNPCSTITLQVKHAVHEVQQNNRFLQAKQISRSKRGAVNIVGNIAHTLFGVLDSEYAEQMSSTIDKIQQNENHISSLVHHQTSFLDTTINIMKRDHEAIKQEFENIEKLFNETSRQLSITHHELYAERITQAFMYLALQTMFAISNLQQIQDSILKILTDTHHGKINPLLISPQQLEGELRKIRENIPVSLRLPMQPSDILNFYNIMTIQGRATEKYIIFKISLPILSVEEFELFKLTPVPVKINDSFVAINPSFPFLIVNLHRDQYYPLAEQDLKRCVTIDEERHMCQQRHPLYKIGSSVSACEINLLNNLPPGSSCSMIKTEPGPHWIQLHNPNQWIYSLERASTINVVCGHNMTQIIIQNAGILNLRSDCIIRQPLITIQGHNIYPTISKMSYIPSINFSDITAAYKVKPALHYTNRYHPHINELESMKQELLKINTQLPNDKLSHNVHHYSIGYLCLCLILGTIIYLFLKTRNKHKRTLSSSTPTTTAAKAEDKEQNSSNSHFITIFNEESG